MILNDVLWNIGNGIIVLIFIAALLFTIIYPILFNPRLTTGGWLIWQAIASVAGIGFLIIIGLYFDPHDDAVWRPLLRVFVYGLVAYTFGRLVVFLIIRRFWPNRVRHRKPKADAYMVETTLSPKPRDLHRKR